MMLVLIQAISFNQTSEVAELVRLVDGIRTKEGLSVSIYGDRGFCRFRTRGSDRIVKVCSEQHWNAVSMKGSVPSGRLYVTLWNSPTTNMWRKLETSLAALTTRNRVKFNAASLQRYVEYHRMQRYPVLIDVWFPCESEDRVDEYVRLCVNQIRRPNDTLGVADLFSEYGAAWRDRFVDCIDRPSGSIQGNEGLFDDVHSFMFAMGSAGERLHSVATRVPMVSLVTPAGDGIVAIDCRHADRDVCREACREAGVLL